MRRRDHDLIVSQALHPSVATKWLILAHVPAPLHWTLVEVRWKTLTLCYYDSFSTAGGYARVVETRVRGLLEIAQDVLQLSVNADKWTWVAEQVCRSYVR